MQINWELVWRIARVALLAVMAALTQELSPMVVQGDDPVTFGPGALAGLMALLSAAEAVYALLKRFGIFKTLDTPKVKAVDSLRQLANADLDSYGMQGRGSYSFADDYDPERTESYIRSLRWSPSTPDDVVTLVAGNIRGYAAHMRASPFSGPLHDPEKTAVPDLQRLVDIQVKAAEQARSTAKAVQSAVPPKQGAD